MSRTWRSLSVAVLFLGLAVTPGWAAVRLTILHTNDTHGHLLPFSYPAVAEAGSILNDLPERRDIGGIARRAALVRRIRDELGREQTPVWLIDAGDICDGTPFSTEYHGEADVAAMNECGYDFGTLGNHEFNNTLAQVRKLVSLARYRILCANATERKSGTPLADPYSIQALGPLRAGIFGLVTREAAGYPAAREGVAIGDPIEAARAVVDRLKGKADFIVLVSHCGETVDDSIARKVPGIDVIVGGHSHSRLPVGEFIWRSDRLMADEVNGTVIVQAFQWGGELGRLDLLLDQDASGRWHLSRWRERLLPVTQDIPEDPRVAAVVDGYWKPIASRYAEVIGQASADFSSRGDDMANYNLVADAVRDVFHTDIELENIGGVRAPLLRGPVTRGDLVALDPFDDTMVTFRIKGRDLRRLLVQTEPAVSGLRYRIEGDSLAEATVAGEPLEDERVYTAAANSYYADRHLQEIGFKDSGRARLDVVMSYIRAQGTIGPRYDGRRVVIPAR